MENAFLYTVHSTMYLIFPKIGEEFVVIFESC